MELFRDTTSILNIRPTGSDKLTKKLMGENTLFITITRATPFEFKVGDYLYFAAEKYTLNVLPKLKKDSSNRFVYDLLFEGIEYELRKVHLLSYTENMGFGGGADFSLMGNAETFVRVIVENLNRIQSGWTIGSVIESGFKNLTFSGNSCLEAISKLATEFETEYWIGNDKTVNLGKRGTEIPITFKYGKGKGLYSIERENVSSKDIVTRLYPYGSQENLPKNYRSNATRLRLNPEYIERNVDKFGIIESSMIFEGIRPEREGTISALGADIFTFVDSGMDFDLNATDEEDNTLYLIPGVKAKVHFQTGSLAGYQFETLYTHATKTFVLKLFTNEVAYDLPNDTLKPAIGDKYILLDIYMPQSYVDAAEVRLYDKAVEAIEQNSEPNVNYSVVADPIMIKTLGLTFAPGDYVHVTDADILVDRDIRIVGITRSLVNPYKYDFTLADTVEPTLTTQVLTTLEATDLVLQMNNLKDPARARRSWLSTLELQGAIFDQDNYFDPANIKPFSIETNMLTVGSKGTQFYTTCYFQANFGGNKNSVVAGNGALAHFTIAEAIRTWTITGLSETIPDDNLRYIFIKCLKVGETGGVILSASQLPIEEENYYNFFAGVVSSVIDNARQISLLFGFTSVNGRFIKTGRVQSADGSTYFDLDTNEIKGNISFIPAGGGYQTVATGISNAQAAANAANALIADIASDNKLTAVEKSSVRTEWNVIAAEKILNVTQATTFGITTEKTTYQNAFAALGTYLNNGGAWTEGTIPTWIADANLATTTDIVGATFRSKFKDYYDSRTALLNAIAEKARVLANTAQSTADAANSLIADISSDNKFTPVEKSQVRSEWEIIFAERTPLQTQSNTFGTTTEFSTYSTKFDNLYTYLNNGTQPTWGAIPVWVNDANLATTTDIVGATFRAKFKEYYDARTALINAITDKARVLANTAQTAANAANALISDISNDNKFTPVEKSQVRAEWDIVAAEKPIILTQADTFGVFPDDYTDAFQALGDYLNGSGVRWTEGTIPVWINDTNLGTTTDIVGATFRSKFRTYYDYRTYILNDIANKARTLANTAQSTADSKSKHFNSQPTTPYRVGDTWTDGVKLYRCTVQRLTGSYTAADWEVAVTYDNTVTVINGGVITSGTIQLGSGDGSGTYVKAGMTGQGDPDTSVRIWAGGTFANRSTANFRVIQNGAAYSRTSFNLEDTSGNILAGIIGGGTGAALRFWAGGSPSSPSTLPFAVFADGSARLTKCDFQSGATGRRIVISSANGDIKLITASDAEAVVIKESLIDSITIPQIYLKYQQSSNIRTVDINTNYCEIKDTLSTLNFNATTFSSERIGGATKFAFAHASFDKLYFLLKGLPTSETGLATSQVYLDASGYLRIKL